MKKIKSNKLILYFFIAAMILILLTPLYLYISTFSENGFSNQSQAWSNFGSYIGGVYGSIFSSISVIVLCFTLYLTKKYNNQQIDILFKSQSKNDFCSLFDSLAEKMNNIDYKGLSTDNEDEFISACEHELFLLLTENHDFYDVVNKTNDIFNSYWFKVLRPYYDVILIASEILQMLDDADNKMKGFFLAYMESKSSTKRLFWLFSFLYHFDEKNRLILDRNLRALRIPKGYI